MSTIPRGNPESSQTIFFLKETIDRRWNTGMKMPNSTLEDRVNPQTWVEQAVMKNINANSGENAFYICEGGANVTYIGGTHTHFHYYGQQTTQCSYNPQTKRQSHMTLL
jgi:hypothetical protein